MRISNFQITLIYIYKFQLNYCGILKAPFIIYADVDYALVSHRRFKCDFIAGEVVINIVGGVQEHVPKSRTCKLLENEIYLIYW
jgi:hypothetical protein